MKDKSLIQRILGHVPNRYEAVEKEIDMMRVRDHDLIRTLSYAESKLLDAMAINSYNKGIIQERLGKAYTETHMARTELSNKVLPTLARKGLLEEGLREPYAFRDRLEQIKRMSAELKARTIELERYFNSINQGTSNHKSIHRQICVMQQEMTMLSESIENAMDELKWKYHLK